MHIYIRALYTEDIRILTLIITYRNRAHTGFAQELFKRNYTYCIPTCSFANYTEFIIHLSERMLEVLNSVDKN